VAGRIRGQAPDLSQRPRDFGDPLENRPNKIGAQFESIRHVGHSPTYRFKSKQPSWEARQGRESSLPGDLTQNTNTGRICH
jgi:hypothetical protein